MHLLVSTLKQLTPGQIYSLGSSGTTAMAVHMASAMEAQLRHWSDDGDALITTCSGHHQTIRQGDKPGRVSCDCTCGYASPARPCAHILAALIVLNSLLRQGTLKTQSPQHRDIARQTLKVLKEGPSPKPPHKPAADAAEPAAKVKVTRKSARPAPSKPRRIRLTISAGPRGQLILHVPLYAHLRSEQDAELLYDASQTLATEDAASQLRTIGKLLERFDINLALEGGDVPCPSPADAVQGQVGVLLDWREDGIDCVPQLYVRNPEGEAPPAEIADAVAVHVLNEELAVAGDRQKQLVRIETDVLWDFGTDSGSGHWQQPLLALDQKSFSRPPPYLGRESVGRFPRLNALHFKADAWFRSATGAPLVLRPDVHLEEIGITCLIDGRPVDPVTAPAIPCLHLEASRHRHEGGQDPSESTPKPFDPSAPDFPKSFLARLTVEVEHRPVVGFQGIVDLVNAGLIYHRLTPDPYPMLDPEKDPVLIEEPEDEPWDEDEEDDPFDDWMFMLDAELEIASTATLDPAYPHPVPEWRIKTAAGRDRFIRLPRSALRQMTELWWTWLDAATAGAEVDMERVKVDLPHLPVAIFLRLTQPDCEVDPFMPPLLVPHEAGDPADRRWLRVDEPILAAIRAIRVGSVLHRQPHLIWKEYSSPGKPWLVSRKHLAENFQQLVDMAALYQVKLLWEGQEVEVIDLDVRLEARTNADDSDWFDLRPEVAWSHFTLDDSDWVQLLSGSMVHEGRLLIAASDSRRRLQALERLLGGDPGRPRRKTDDDAVRAPRLQMFDWLELRQHGVEVDMPDDVVRLIDRLRQPDQIESMPLPAKLRADLRPYQQRGYQWLAFLYSHRLGACLADDMGLGKTVQAIALLGGLHEGTVPRQRPDQPPRPHLIVLPPTLVFNWCNELERFYPDLEVIEFRGGRGQPDFPPGSVVLTTYDQVRLQIEKLAPLGFECIIFDEAQAAKTWTSQRAKAARRLQGRFRICLTGTPLENHVGEYHSIMELALPGLFGDRRQFMQAVKDDGPQSNTLLNRARPFVMRRTKGLILKELPPKIETEITLPCNPLQREMYTRTVAEVRDDIAQAYQLKNQAKAGIKALAALMRLRQICISPALLDPARQEPSPKLTVLAEKLRELLDEGEAALVFSQFTKALDQVEVVLGANDIPFQRLDGATPKPQRRKRVEAFQDGSGPGVFLISLKTGGAGLNLTRASHVFHLDPWWNPAVEHQATDRAHRIGQTGTVFVHRLLMQHTIEESMMVLKRRKQAVYDRIMAHAAGLAERGTDSSGGASTALLTREDFEFLIGSGDDGDDA